MDFSVILYPLKLTRNWIYTAPAAQQLMAFILCFSGVEPEEKKRSLQKRKDIETCFGFDAE